MMEDLSYSSLLNGLDDRVVRGAKPGLKNDPDSGLLYITTGAYAETGYEIKEYLMQPEADPNTDTLTGGEFTLGSQTVSFTDPDPSKVEVGDFVRPATGGNLYYVSSVGTTTLTLAETFKEDSVDNVDIQIQKREFNSVTITSYQNNDSTDEFEYSSKKNEWLLLEGAVGTSHSSVDPSFTVDAIEYHTVSVGETGNADLTFLGRVDKNLPTTQTDTPIVTFTPVPYPSDLSVAEGGTGPGDISGFQLYKNPSVTPLVYGEDFLLSYTVNPVYDGYRPFSKDATIANIHALTGFSVSSTPSSPTINLATGGSAITSIYGESVEVIAGATGPETLIKDVDYILNESTGTLSFIGFEMEESPVDNILTDLDGNTNGLEVSVISASGDFADITESDITYVRPLVEGQDFAVNDLNGGFGLITQIEPGNYLRVNYLVPGSAKTQTKSEPANDLRLDYFPVVRGTVKVTGDFILPTKKTAKVSLVEGVDFNLFYSNGIIDLIGSKQGLWQNIYVSYTPASSIVCYLNPLPTATGIINNFSVKGVGVPVGALSDRSIDLGIEKDSLQLVALKDFAGASVNLEGLTPLSPTSFKWSTPHPRIQRDGGAFAFFTYEGGSLPYLPLTRLTNTLERGASSFVLENVIASSIDLTVGSLVLIRSLYDPNQRFYANVTEILDLDGVNTKISIDLPAPFSVNQPEFAGTDTIITFETEVEADLETYGNNANSLTFTNAKDFKLYIGSLLKLSDTQIVGVTSISRNGSSLTVGINPVTNHSIVATAPIQYTAKPVYVEGDTVLSLSKDVYAGPTPIARLERDPDSKETRTKIAIANGELSFVDQVEGESANSSIAPLSDTLSVDELLSSVSFVDFLADPTPLGNIDLTVLNSASLADTEVGFNPKQLPHVLKAYPTILKNGTFLHISTTTEIKDYSIQGGKILLTNPIQKGDEFVVSYGYTTLDNVGSEVIITGKRFAQIAEGTSYKIKTDYLAADQFYTQAMKEKTYQTSVLNPYLEAAAKSKRGVSPLGSKGIEASSESGNSQGGVKDNYFELRELYLSANTMERVSNEYYKARLAAFAKEYAKLEGTRLGNNDFEASDSSRNRMTSKDDLNYQATYGFSKYFPDGYKGNTPVPDGRFSQTYTAYEKVFVYNSSTQGFLKGWAGSRFTDRVTTGDAVRPEGVPNFYTISAVSNDTITVDTPFDGFPVWTPPSGINGNLKFEIKRTSVPDAPFMDGQGFFGAYAESTVSAPYYYAGESITFEELNAKGESIGSHSYVGTTLGALSASELAELLQETLNEGSYNYLVTTETVYNRDTLKTELSKAIDASWPLVVPETGTTTGTRTTVVIRCVTPTGGGFRFTSIPAILGFDTDPYLDYVDGWNVHDVTIEEGESRQIESTGLLGTGAIHNILDTDRYFRGGTGGQTDDMLAVDNSIGNTSLLTAALDDVLSEAIDGTDDIKLEGGATGTVAVMNSYTEANAMSILYANQLSNIASIEDKDSAMQEYVNANDTLVNGRNACAALNAYTIETKSRAEASDELESTFDSTGIPSFEVTSATAAGYDPRILIGGTAPFGPGYTNISVFPTWGNNPYWGVTFSETPRGSWSPAGATYSSTGTHTFVMNQAATLTGSNPGSTYTTTSTSMTLFDGTISYPVINFSSYPTLGLLKNHIEGLGGGFTFTIAGGSSTSTFYGNFVKVSVVDITTPANVYYGIMADFKFGSISDEVLLGRIEDTAERQTQLSDFRTAVSARKTEIESSLSAESVAAYRQQWENWNADRVWGPINRIVPLKRSIRGD